MKIRKLKTYFHRVENQAGCPKTKSSSIFPLKGINSLFSDYILVTHQAFFIYSFSNYLLSSCNMLENELVIMVYIESKVSSLKILSESEEKRIVK